MSPLLRPELFILFRISKTIVELNLVPWFIVDFEEFEKKDESLDGCFLHIHFDSLKTIPFFFQFLNLGGALIRDLNHYSSLQCPKRPWVNFHVSIHLGCLDICENV